MVELVANDVPVPVPVSLLWESTPNPLPLAADFPLESAQDDYRLQVRSEMRESLYANRTLTH